MAFNLHSLGIKINQIQRDNIEELILSFCLNTVDNNKANISSQLLLANKSKLTNDLIDKITKNLYKKLIDKRKYLVKNLNVDNLDEKLSKFIFDYTKGLKTIDITFDLSNSSEELFSYGNSEFIKKNLLILNDLIIYYPKIRQIIEDFIFKNLNENYNYSFEIFKFLKKLGNYNITILSDIYEDIIKWNEQEIIIPPYENYFKEIYKFNTNMGKIYKINKFIKKNLPKGDYSNIYIPLIDNLFDSNLNTILSFPKESNFYFLLNNIPKLDKILNYLTIEKKGYFQNILDEKFNQSIQNVNKLMDFENILNVYKDYIYLQPEIGDMLNSKFKNEFNDNILSLIKNLDNNLIPVLSVIVNNFMNYDEVLIKLKYQLCSNLFNIKLSFIEKIQKFMDNLYTKNNNFIIIKSILADIKISSKFSELSNPNKIFMFSRGVWDFPMDYDYKSIGLVSDHKKYLEFVEHPFREEIVGLATITFQGDDKDIILFQTKGSIKMELNDGKKILNCEFLPIQAYIIKMLLEKNTISENDLKEFISKNGINSVDKVIDTLKDLIKKDKSEYYLKKNLPYEGTKNYAELYFIETQEIILDKIEEEIKLSLEEVLSSNICSILKKENNYTLEKTILFDRLKEIKYIKHDFNFDDFNNILSKMFKKDYLVIIGEFISYQVY